MDSEAPNKIEDDDFPGLSNDGTHREAVPYEDAMLIDVPNGARSNFTSAEQATADLLMPSGRRRWPHHLSNFSPELSKRV